MAQRNLPKEEDPRGDRNRWEYRVLPWHPDSIWTGTGGMEGVTEMLRSMGAEGWELAGNPCTQTPKLGGWCLSAPGPIAAVAKRVADRSTAARRLLCRHPTIDHQPLWTMRVALRKRQLPDGHVRYSDCSFVPVG